MYIGQFHPSDGGYRSELDLEARLIIGRISSEIVTLLDAPANDADLLHALALDERREEPEDPALRSLLPQMSDDPHEAAALRTLTEDTLRLTKSERLVRIMESLEDLAATQDDALEIHAEHAWEWLCALNDMRLVLAQRLEVKSPQDAEGVTRRAEAFLTGTGRGSQTGQPQSHSEDVIAALYAIVTWWQDSLLQAVRFNEFCQ